ncbi:MAG: tripartite tricarboxylate transporter substrate binding protein [Candidimonas sp.]|nr:MAG: tripartite tricarboxylate transporter substrate binding protein [Candidimonas sp.]TAM21635.1 MAG: tripartite tricarboxylate transporter substrate binding protein [Candidimonas sp.]TAM79959.1 MAG: tripartite tricarboxylate transporter substrate binding protein [Candidimonas sp.]
MIKPAILTKRIKLLALLPVLLMSIATSAAAQTYPSRTVNIVVPYAAGGSTDTTARLVAKGLSDQLGQTFIVVNKPGAGGQIAQGYVAHAPADGYTLLFSAAGPLTVTPHSYAKLPYDPLSSFKTIKLVAAVPLVLLVNPKLGVKTLPMLVEKAKHSSNALTFGSFGIGSAAHLAGELFKSLAKINLVHVPYNGSAPALVGLLGGQTDMMFDVLTTALPQIKDGKLVPLAVTSTTRSPLLPNVPTMAQAGIQGFESETWFGLLAPVKANDKIVQKLSQAMNVVLAEPKFKATLLAQGMQIKGGTPQQFNAFFHSEYKKWGKIAKEAGIQKH